MKGMEARWRSADHEDHMPRSVRASSFDRHFAVAGEAVKATSGMRL